MKPLGRKAYGSIPHLPGSRRGPGDHGTTEGMARILTAKPRDDRDRIIVTEKLDGTNVAVAKIDGALVALGRSGHTALSSKWEHVRLFDQWVNAPEQYERFDPLLTEGDWVSGEWLALAHGTRYNLIHRDPFAVFDLFRDGERLPTYMFRDRCWQADIQTVPFVDEGRPLSINDALRALGDGEDTPLLMPQREPSGASSAGGASSSSLSMCGRTRSRSRPTPRVTSVVAMSGPSTRVASTVRRHSSARNVLEN